MASPAVQAGAVGSAGFGLHLGSSAACVAFTKDGRVDVVANDLGDRTTPCFVAFTEHDMAVGFAAKQGYVRNTKNTIYHVKQLLGKPFQDETTKQFMNKKQVQVVNRKEDVAFEVDFKGKVTVFSVSEILEILFKKLLEIGQSKAGKGCFDAVLAVPVSFTTDQENLLRQIATKVGFQVLRIIHEPAAAALAYDVQQDESCISGYVLVFRLGGVSCDVTLIKLCGGIYSIVAGVSDYSLGGDNFTEVLLQHLQGEFKRQCRHDISDNSRSIAKLQRGAEMCKHALSTVNNSHCSVESLYDGMDFSTSVSRARFESLCTSLKNRCVAKIEEVLSNADLQKSDIEKVILCGGGSKVPLVQKMVSETFPNAKLLNHIPPDEVIAIGAAKETSILKAFKNKLIPESEHQNKVKILSQAIAVKVRENRDKTTYKDFQTVFSKSTPIPSHQKFVFSASSQESAFFLDVLELDDCPERDEGDENSDKLLASVVMKNIAQEAPISTSFILTRDKFLEVVCQEETTNKKLTVQIPVR
ncbi:heat shock 70 kDa protein 14 [Octopus sinensis]|uniref:Heat shock 70 kDa protein 14 n=1 Tax=Octopus sinensis TaxID=2607531 RepID=A0A6P7SBI1_9MOLL|nr:heat shock 70 kDa protein 14 [Octopus sinensis]